MTMGEDGSLEVHQNATMPSANALAQQSVQDLLEWKHYKSVAQATAVFSFVLRWIAKVVKRVNPDLKESICDRIPELRTYCKDELPTVAEHQNALRFAIISVFMLRESFNLKEIA
ncbi:unnamed protein product [Heligmosomoides polygyrus]|uniref:DUF3453 domain-containing protein n=1 Tax=Heligmosomoides polygyrus TaxID=6339 RepID=A0A183G253_HELPZ|nr:unnamed protein product [Heligmosomoides polygyrus]